ncbi:MAG: hypothetical protein GXP55_19155 [Deltaproteobacteria bacterium]|nr:hypothetical protein [Deltaproteobacteria bacterium]
MRYAIALTLVTGLISMTGCGDDSGGSDSGMDATTGMDSSVDSGRDSGRDGGMDATTDGSTDSGPADAGSVCDPHTADSCPSGEKCSVVLVFGPAPDNTLENITFGCVDDTRAKGERAPCSRNRDATPDNTDDNTVSDDCQQGLFCFTAETASANVCRPLCSGGTIDCGEGKFCLGLNSEPAFGVCQTAQGCDPVFQTGCTAGKACYTIGATNGDLLGACFVPSAQDGGVPGPGEACRSLDGCQAGSGCFPEELPDGGFGDSLCRSFCTTASFDAGVPTDAGSADAGSMDGGVSDAGPSDAGTVFTGACTTPATCLPLDVGDAAVRVPIAPGRCQ